MKPQSRLQSQYSTYIKPLTKIPVVRNYGSIIFSLFIITVFIFYAIKPTVETILVLQKKLDNSTEVLEKINLKATNLSLGKQNYDNLPTNTKSKIQTLIPDSVNLRSLIQDLEQTALKHQASISSLQIQPLVVETKNEIKMGALTPISFTFNATGEYQNLVSVLQDLKISARLISIDNLSLSSSEDLGVIMTISGKAYYIK